ncbi:HalOD1 output domain-containing protein [Halalkalicoccus ordinarius]|uniref:HalOD1 output domain-containing protein n=1 Tax=Halalkalicoccus ordinarius TaxID=3116651 RepID=UPI00300EE4DA
MNDWLAAPNATDPTPVCPPVRSASESIVSAVANAKAVSPLDLPPLYPSIDPDALDAFVASLNDSRDEREGAITFAYDSYEVTVTGNGDVSLAESGR